MIASLLTFTPQTKVSHLLAYPSGQSTERILRGLPLNFDLVI